VYLQRGRNQTTNSNFLSHHIRNKITTIRDSHPLSNSCTNQPSNHSPTHVQAASGQTDNPVPSISLDLSNTITNFLEDLKSLINFIISYLNKVI